MAEVDLECTEGNINNLEAAKVDHQAIIDGIEAQLKHLHNECRDLQLEAVGLKHGDKLLMNEGTANYYCNALWHVFRMANNKDNGVMIQKCGGVGIVVRSVEVVQRMRQAYLDSVAEAATD